MKKLIIKTKQYSYPLFIGRNINLEEQLNSFKDKRLFIITDSNLERLYLEYLRKQLATFRYDIITVNAGEESKSIEVYKIILNRLFKLNIQKKDVIIAFGGGVVGDLAGFIAATVYRGVSFVNIPTSLLAMADSSIGGKTGIDAVFGKNLIGAYKQPELVLIDLEFLKTLEKDEYKNGLAEIIKAGFIYDKRIIRMLLRKKHNEDKLLLRAIKVKKAIVIKDPYENYLRMVLNFGHTFGHAIEQFHNYEYKHGLCVAMGMHLALIYGIKSKQSKPKTLKILTRLYEKYELPLFKSSSDIYLENIKYDKKSINDEVYFIVAPKIGKAKIVKILKESLYDLSN